MVTGHVRHMQLTDPRKVRVEYGKRIWSEVFDHNPRIAWARDLNVQVYEARPNGLRPYASAKSALRWTWQDYRPYVGELYFQPDELAYAARFTPDVVIEPNLKGMASPNKDWGGDRWVALARMMAKAGIRPVQLGGAGTRLMGPPVEFIETRNFRHACAVLARARAAVLTEGGLHHGAAAVGLKAVVIFGGYISPHQTGYDLHVNLFSGGTACGMRTTCPHCKQAMAKITPEEVFSRLQGLLRG